MLFVKLVFMEDSRVFNRTFLKVLVEVPHLVQIMKSVEPLKRVENGLQGKQGQCLYLLTQQLCCLVLGKKCHHMQKI